MWLVVVERKIHINLDICGYTLLADIQNGCIIPPSTTLSQLNLSMFSDAFAAFTATYEECRCQSEERILLHQSAGNMMVITINSPKSLISYKMYVNKAQGNYTSRFYIRNDIDLFMATAKLLSVALTTCDFLFSYNLISLNYMIVIIHLPEEMLMQTINSRIILA
uniref:IgGFc_binding domain-containing protein n=1 Tax=Elaeophora elaphi TaxID=1147741 RepID=A0A0R3RIY3_9BILA